MLEGYRDALHVDVPTSANVYVLDHQIVTWNLELGANLVFLVSRRSKWLIDLVLTLQYLASLSCIQGTYVRNST